MGAIVGHENNVCLAEVFAALNFAEHLHGHGYFLFWRCFVGQNHQRGWSLS